MEKSYEKYKYLAIKRQVNENNETPIHRDSSGVVKYKIKSPSHLTTFASRLTRNNCFTEIQATLKS